MKHKGRCDTRLKAVALGLGLALTLLSSRYWYETFLFGHPLCENCRTDFPSLYAGAKLMWENSTALYDLEQQLAIQKSIDARLGDSALAFAYPPLTAVLLMPLGWLSFAKAYLGMALLNGALLVFALKLLNKSLQLSPEQFSWLALSTLCNFGVHSTFIQGQTSFIVLVLTAALMRSILQKDQVTAGFWSAALFVKPQFLPVPFLVLAVTRHWRGVGIGLLVVGTMAIFSGVLVGWEGIANYMRVAVRFTSNQTELGTNPQDMHNLRALALYVFSPATASYLWGFLCAAVLVGIVLLNFRSHRGNAALAAQGIGNLLAALLLSPHLHAHDLALLVIINALVLKNYENAIPAKVPLALVPVGLLPLFSLTFRNQLPPVLPVIFLTIFFYCVWYVRQKSVVEPDALKY